MLLYFFQRDEKEGTKCFLLRLQSREDIKKKVTPFLYELFGQPNTFTALKDHRKLCLDHADFSEQKKCSQLAIVRSKRPCKDRRGCSVKLACGM